MDLWRRLPKNIRQKTLTYVTDKELENPSLAGRSMREDVESLEHFRMRDAMRHKDDAKDVYTRRIRLENAKLISFTLSTSESDTEMPSWYLMYDMNEDDIKRALNQFIIKTREAGWPLIPTQYPEDEISNWEAFIQELKRSGSGTYMLSHERGPFDSTHHIQVIISPILREVERLPHMT